MCFAYTLDHDRRIAFSYWFLFLQVGVPYRVLLLAPYIPLVGHHSMPLCYSSLPCVASFCSVGFFLLASFPCFAVLCPWPLVLLLALLHYFHLLRPLSLSLFLSCSSLSSLGGPPVPSWPSVIFGLCSLVGSHPGGPFLVSRVSAPRVWGFLVVSLVFSFRVRCFPFFPLGASCDVGVPCMPSASFLSVKFLVALCVFCVRCSFFLLSWFHGYLACPASASPRHRSLFLSPHAPFRSLSRPFFSLPRGVFSSAAWPSSSALSSSSVH